jgi:ferric-dicitrate binding protein FerR (iron transport regulator)
MTPERLSDLASRFWEAGTLSPEEERELGQALRESAEARRLVQSYFRLEGAIVEQARAGLVSAPLAARPPASLKAGAPPVRSWAPWVAGLAAAALLIGLLLTARTPSEPASSSRISRSPDVPLVPSPNDAPRGVPPAASTPAPDAVAKKTAPSVARDEELHPQRFPQPVPPAPPAPPPAPDAVPEPALASDVARAPEAVVTDVLIERTEGEVFVSGSGPRVAGRSGDPIRPGQNVETGTGKSLAVLAFPDGSRIEARPDTLIRDIRERGGAASAGGKSLTLQRGAVWAQIRPQPAERPLVVQTPRGEARVLGTIFTMRIDPDARGSLRLDVQEGKVRFTRSSDNRSVDVAAGHSVSSGQGADLVLLRSQEVVQSFQDGRFPATDYAGTRDTTIAEKNPQSNFGGSRTLVAEAEDAKEKKKASWTLLRWDVSSIPPGSLVHSVSVTLHVLEPSRGQAFYFFEPARSWSETEASWKFASPGNLWRFPGSLGGVERWPSPLGTIAPLQKGEYTSVLGDAGVALVQSWINVPAGNAGLQIAGPTSGAGIRFSSREAPSVEARPRLTIVFSPKK